MNNTESCNDFTKNNMLDKDMNRNSFYEISIESILQNLNSKNNQLIHETIRKVKTL